jgi:hypothetical protein
MGVTFAKLALSMSPLAAWRLGDLSGTTAVDSTGNNRGMTYFNSPTLGGVSGVPFDPDASVHFNASLSQAAWRNAQIPNAFPYTLLCLFNADNATSHHPLLGFGTTGTNNYWTGIAARGDVTGDPLSAQIFYFGDFHVYSTAAYTANNWHLACGVFESNKITVYLDNNVGVSTTHNRSIFASTAQRTAIGSVQQLTKVYASASIDEAYLFGTALSATDVLDLYKAWQAPNPLYFLRQREAVRRVG